MARAFPACLVAILVWPGLAAPYERILLPETSHPAVGAAAQILARNLSVSGGPIAINRGSGAPHVGEIVFASARPSSAQAKLLGSAPQKIANDGYVIIFDQGGAIIYGRRPRSFLYAAADAHLWKDQISGSFLRDPSFAIRSSVARSGRTVAEQVAALGVNMMTVHLAATPSFRKTLPEIYARLSPAEQKRLDGEAQTHAPTNAKLMQECRDADVTCYASLPYGNNFSRWSPVLYAAVIKAYPSSQGTPAPASWEKAALCPSDPITWRVFGAYLRELAEQTQADGLSATFWDQYGLYCQCDRCKSNGLNQFPNQLYESIKHYHSVLAPMGKKLMLRTWSSGVPHWLGSEYVHAPGYDGFGGSGVDLWGRVIRELPADIILQTKVYHSDCQPDPRPSTLLGHAQPHTEIVEYQVTGQTLGRHYFPTSIVDYMASTLGKSLELVGPTGGAQIDPGGTHQVHFSIFDDIVNSINVYAWRELTWSVNADLDKIWKDWAVQIYGEAAAPHVVRALRLSEETVYRTFSPLGMGSSTNSDFAATIARRETLLRYTNRYYLPEYAKSLDPTKENIQRVIDEKSQCLRKIDEMLHELDLARPHLRVEQASELATRFDWLREFAIVSRYLEESLWRFRYLRHLSSVLTTDPEQMKHLAEAYDGVREHQRLLFRFDPAQKLSCYDIRLGDLGTTPGLGNPIPLMQELYAKSRAYVEESAGPEAVPLDWRRPKD